MADTILDFEKITAAINADNPVGDDLRGDAFLNDYYQIKDARSAARTDERKSLENGESITTVASSWRPLLDLCRNALSDKTKDIEIASWLTEALVRIHGFAGLRDGFRLLKELISSYWPAIYPQEDEEGLETKVIAIEGLSGAGNPGTLVMPIHCVPIVSGNGQEYATWQYQQSLEVAKLTDESAKKQRIESGAIPLDDLKLVAKATSVDFFNKVKQELQACRDEFAELNEVLAEKCGEVAPEMGNVRRALDDCHNALEALTKHLNEEAAEETEGSEVGVVGTTGDIKISANVSGNRAQLFQQLQEIAAFFRKTEPHSPISYLLEQAVRWGEMELPELMQELLEQNTLKNYYRLVGIKPPAPPQAAPAPNNSGGMGMPPRPSPMGSPHMGGSGFGGPGGFDDDFGGPGDFDFPGSRPPPFPGGDDF